MIRKFIILIFIVLANSSNINSQNYIPSFVTGDIFIYGFDNKIDAKGSNLLLLSNKVSIDNGDQFGILGHNSSYDLEESALQATNALNYISLVYSAEESLPPASKLSIKLIAKNQFKIIAVKIFDGTIEITNNFSIDIVGLNAPMSSTENTSLYLYSGTWLDNEEDDDALLFGQVIGGINYTNELNEDSEVTVDSENGVLQLPASAASSTTGTSGGPPVSVTSIFVILDCDGLLFICDIASLLAASDSWVIEEGSNDNELLIEYLESIICDFLPDSCLMDFDILPESLFNPFDCYNNSFPVSVHPYEGTPPYHIVWKDENGLPVIGGANHVGASSSVIITESGTYTICVTDNRGCTAMDTVTYIVPEPLKIFVEQDQDICEGDSVTLMVMATQGIPPYRYLWSTGDEETEITVSNIYKDVDISVTVTDAYECTKVGVAEINIMEPPSLYLSWEYCNNTLLLEEENDEFCSETILERYNDNSSQWDTIGSFSYFNRANGGADYRVRRVCECGDFYSNVVPTLTLEVEVDSCLITVVEQPCDTVCLDLYVDGNHEACACYVDLPTTFTVSGNGNGILSIYCAGSCDLDPYTRWWYHEYFTVYDCDVYGYGGGNMISNDNDQELNLSIVSEGKIIEELDKSHSIYSRLEKREVSVIPNPANNYVDIVFSSKSDKQSQIQLYTSSGQLVLKTIKYGDQTTKRLETRDLEDGLYFIRVKEGNFSKTLKLVISH